MGCKFLSVLQVMQLLFLISTQVLRVAFIACHFGFVLSRQQAHNLVEMCCLEVYFTLGFLEGALNSHDAVLVGLR